MAWRWVLDPAKVQWIAYWDLVTTVALILTSTITPVEVAFLQPLPMDQKLVDVLFWLNRTVDAIFIFDMHLQFRVAVRLPGTEIRWLRNPKEIAMNYLQGKWFWIDLFSVLTMFFDLVGGEDVRDLVVLRAIRVLRLAKCAASPHASLPPPASSLLARRADLTCLGAHLSHLSRAQTDSPHEGVAPLQGVGNEALDQLPGHGAIFSFHLHPDQLPLVGMHLGAAGELCASRQLARRQRVLRAVGRCGRTDGEADASRRGLRNRGPRRHRPIRHLCGGLQHRSLRGRNVHRRLCLCRVVSALPFFNLLCGHDDHERRLW